MSNTAIKFFNWVTRYKVTATDMNAQQSALSDEYRGLFEILAGAYTNIELSIPSGLSVSAASGIAVGGLGRICQLSSAATATFTSPSGNPAKSLLVLRPSETAVDSTVSPTNPLATFFLHNRLDTTLVAINGTPAGSPVYPSTQAGDVVLCGVTLTNGQTTIGAADIDFSVRNIPRLDLMKSRSYSSRIIGAGSVAYAPSLNLQSGHTWTGAGDIHAAGAITGTGVLATTGTIYS